MASFTVSVTERERSMEEMLLRLGLQALGVVLRRLEKKPLPRVREIVTRELQAELNTAIERMRERNRRLR